MTGSILHALTFAAALGSGLMAGLFFAFSNSVMGALARLPAAQGVAAMNSINVVIVNPLFLTLFLGTAAVCAVAAVMALFQWNADGSAWLLAASLFYLAGIIAVTMVFNVPLNDALAAVDPASTEASALWARYLNEWVMWNHVRTVAGIAALASFIMTLRQA
jgi:uncharacterized membrane protein